MSPATALIKEITKFCETQSAVDTIIAHTHTYKEKKQFIVVLWKKMFICFVVSYVLLQQEHIYTFSVRLLYNHCLGWLKFWANNNFVFATYHLMTLSCFLPHQLNLAFPSSSFPSLCLPSQWFGHGMKWLHNNVLMIINVLMLRP